MLGTDGFPRLVEDARAGSTDAFGQLYLRFQRRLLAYLRAYDSPNAEDLATEVWIGAAAGLGRFEGDEHDFRRWLYAIARRRVIDERRRRQRRPSDAVAPEVLAPLPGPADTEESVVELLETERLLRDLTRLLTRDQADVLLLRVVAGLPVDDVSRIVNKQPEAVRALQHRALQRLARRLDRRGHGAAD